MKSRETLVWELTQLEAAALELVVVRQTKVTVIAMEAEERRERQETVWERGREEFNELGFLVCIAIPWTVPWAIGAGDWLEAVMDAGALAVIAYTVISGILLIVLMIKYLNPLWRRYLEGVIKPKLLARGEKNWGRSMAKTKMENRLVPYSERERRLQEIGRSVGRRSFFDGDELDFDKVARVKQLIENGSAESIDEALALAK